MKVSISTLSKATGFSRATVSNALNGKRGVNKETAEAILAAAKKYGYVPENKVKNIKFIVYKNSGSIVSDTPFFSALIEGAEQECRNYGYEMIVYNLNRNNSDFESVRSQLLNDPNSPILLLATEMSEEDIGVFQQAQSPVVIIDSWFDEMSFNAVLVSNTDSVCNAVKYLIDKGHRKIGYLKSNIRTKTFFYREMGYQRALSLSGIARDPAFEIPLSPTMNGAYDDMLAFLRQNPTMPSAFFADDDMIALGVMKALQQRNYRIPEDISIIGFDDLIFSEIATPPLTTIRICKQEMGQAAVERLMAIIRNESKVKMKIQVCGEFIERASVKDLRGS